MKFTQDELFLIFKNEYFSRVFRAIHLLVEIRLFKPDFGKIWELSRNVMDNIRKSGYLIQVQSIKIKFTHVNRADNKIFFFCIAG